MASPSLNAGLCLVILLYVMVSGVDARRLHRRGIHHQHKMAHVATPLEPISKVQHESYLASRSTFCPDRNGTEQAVGRGATYQLVCDQDYPISDTYPFLKTTSLAACVSQCINHNQGGSGDLCLAVVYVPGRIDDTDNCYLKKSLDYATTPTFPTQVGILHYGNTSSMPASMHIVQASKTSDSQSTASLLPSLTSTQDSSTFSDSSFVYANGSQVITPDVASTRLLGPSVNDPTTQYIDYTAPSSPGLASNMLIAGVNRSLSTGYPISPETGILQLNSSTEDHLANLTDVPQLSRDGGKGGLLGGQHLFLFDDTGSYSDGTFLGFVSGSVAIDVGSNGVNGRPIVLQDGIGEWSDNTGRMRGLTPLTDGEQSYNLVMQGQGYRYAVWVESTFVPLHGNDAVILAPLVYDTVDMSTKAANFTYSGATMLVLTGGGEGGPYATRAVNLMFYADEVEWGCIGGIRSWGASGVGGSDGTVYFFGKTDIGLLLARTNASTILDRDSFEYWQGSSWSGDMPSPSATSFFLEGNFMDIDIFYSPRHLTFIAVYMTAYADSTFYYRYLMTDTAIKPEFAGGPVGSDYVENIVKGSWSDEQVLYKAPSSLSGQYVYSGGVHLGYFNDNDIFYGGAKMLLSWTAPTGQLPSSNVSEYQIMTAEVDWY